VTKQGYYRLEPVHETFTEPLKGFIHRVETFTDVVCIVAEEANGVLHICTFINGPLEDFDEIEHTVYDAEYDTMETYPNLQFDWHLREAPENILNIRGHEDFVAIWLRGIPGIPENSPKN